MTLSGRSRSSVKNSITLRKATQRKIWDFQTGRPGESLLLSAHGDRNTSRPLMEKLKFTRTEEAAVSLDHCWLRIFLERRYPPQTPRRAPPPHWPGARCSPGDCCNWNLPRFGSLIPSTLQPNWEVTVLTWHPASIISGGCSLAMPPMCMRRLPIALQN